MYLCCNQFDGTIPPEIGDLTNLVHIDFAGSQLTGSIPPEIGNLKNLETFTCFGSTGKQLTGSIPPEMGNLSNLTSLILYGNQLTGSIPAKLGSLSKLNLLWLDGNQLTDSIPAELGNLDNLTSLDLHGNQLTGNIPSKLGDLSHLERLDLGYNQLSGNFPRELGYLNNLTILNLSRNELNGEILTNFESFSSLESLSLSENQLSGILPVELGNLNKLNYLSIDNNYFSCNDIQTSFQHFSQIDNFRYSPQYFRPVNYDLIKRNVFDTIKVDQSLTLEIDLPFDTTGLTFQWFRNENIIPGETEPSLSLDTIQLDNVGKYTLQVVGGNCLSEGITFITISEPMYVIVKGYDLFGQPVEYNEIMVEFDNTAETRKYEDKILTPNAGWVEESCNCNRELYLWKFNSAEEATNALIEIDQKTKIVKSTTQPKGGFNNNLRIGEPGSTQNAYKVMSNTFKHNYPDSVSVFVLDTGFGDNDNTFLYNQASIDTCYDISAQGYSYIDTTITTNYFDDIGHGTFGFYSITDSLNEDSKLKLVPLKIFDESGKGTLFDMVCALYHAIDHDADIINISAGYQGGSSDILESAINLARKKDIFIIAAAGNDTLNMDNHYLKQYPAYYAGQYYYFYVTDVLGQLKLDSVKLDNVVSVASVDAQNSLSHFSNYGNHSVTLASYGENIHGYGIEGADEIASGTSIATYFATKALALEIAHNNSRNYQEIWKDFETNWLKENPLLVNITQTGKQINFELVPAEIEGCMDETNCYYFPYANINNDEYCMPAFINANNETSKFIEAGDSIISCEIIESLDTVNYKAGDEIILKDGFEVKVNSTFSAEIIECFE